MSKGLTLLQTTPTLILAMQGAGSSFPNLLTHSTL